MSSHHCGCSADSGWGEGQVGKGDGRRSSFTGGRKKTLAVSAGKEWRGSREKELKGESSRTW